MQFPFSKNSLHHAYILTGDVSSTVIMLRNFLENELGMVTPGHSDVSIEESESFGIDDSRRIKERHSLRSLSENGKRVTILAVQNITSEAQNSLLKLFEEPTPGTHFFLIVPSLHIVLPTLRSRALHIDLRTHKSTKLSPEATQFLTGGLKAALDVAAQIAKSITDEKSEKSDARKFLAELLPELKANPRAQKVILEAEKYISSRGSSVKLLLENIAITLYT